MDAHKASPTEEQENPLLGGIAILLEADIPDAQEVTDSEMSTTRTIIQNRIIGLGVADAVVLREGDRQILVQLPPMEDPEWIIATIMQTGLLELVDMSEITFDVAFNMQEAGTPIVTDLSPYNSISPTQKIWHTVLTGAAITNVAVYAEMGHYNISFELSSEGAKIFEDFTAQHIGKILAIVIDKKILSAPTINDAIPDGKGVISGNFTRDEANQLAIQLQYGSLLVPLKIVETREIK